MIEFAEMNGAQKSDCLILPVWEDKKFDSFVSTLDDQTDGRLTALTDAKDFSGKIMEMGFVYPGEKNLKRVLLVGLGKQKELSVQRFDQVMGAAVIAAQGKKAKHISLYIPAGVIKKLGAKKSGREVGIAVTTASYSFDAHKDKEARVQPIKKCTLIVEDTRTRRDVEKGAGEGNIIGEAMNFLRDLGNASPSIMTPEKLASEAKKLGVENKNIKVKVLGKPEIKKLGMGCFLGVASGSQHDPQFIIATYNGGKKADKPTLLVGKGITFDSGGLSIKPGDYMCDMKFDMLGAATALATIKAAAALGLKKNIVVLAPTCENMPGGEAYRPDDILHAMNGKSVEIGNTDAEGRLILADALSYAGMKYEPKEVIDFATLTGACMVAIGLERSGLFSPEKKMVDKLLKAAEEAGENLWHLPLGPEFSEAMKSQVADIRNIANIRYGGASTAAAFLQFFTTPKGKDKPYPWAHIDLSSSYNKGKGKPWIRGGANGFGVQTLIEYLRG